jgi:sterol O-acyltransferase
MAVPLPDHHEDQSVVTSLSFSPEPGTTASSASLSSIEDYDDDTTSLVRQRASKAGASAHQGMTGSSHQTMLPSIQTDHDIRTFVVSAHDDEIREVLRHGLQRARDPLGKSRVRAKFSDLVFTRKFSAFDRQNSDAANSPFSGFFTLFWMAMFFFMIKIAAENWKQWGNPFGTNEIVQLMVQRDLFVLLAADGVLCGSTGVSWLLQRFILAGYIDWTTSGMVIQNVSFSTSSKVSRFAFKSTTDRGLGD